LPPSYDINNTCNIAARDGASIHNRTGPVFAWIWSEDYFSSIYHQGNPIA